MTHPALRPAPLDGVQKARALANALNGSTLLGLAVARWGRARVRRGPRGLWLAERYRFAFPVAGAFTIGDVVITRHEWTERVTAYPDLVDHEERHSRQYAVCGGLPFIPLYAAAMAWSWLRTGDRASANVFERRAGLQAGGYRERPTRPLSALWQPSSARQA